MPSSVITIKADASSQKIFLDQDPLLKVLSNLRQYSKSLNEATLATLRAELDGQMDAVKRDLLISMEEGMLQVDTRLQPKLDAHAARMDSICSQLAEADTHCRSLAETTSELGEKIDNILQNPDVLPSPRTATVRGKGSKQPLRLSTLEFQASSDSRSDLHSPQESASGQTSRRESHARTSVIDATGLGNDEAKPGDQIQRLASAPIEMIPHGRGDKITAGEEEADEEDDDVPPPPPSAARNFVKAKTTGFAKIRPTTSQSHSGSLAHSPASASRASFERAQANHAAEPAVAAMSLANFATVTDMKDAEMAIKDLEHNDEMFRRELDRMEAKIDAENQEFSRALDKCNEMVRAVTTRVLQQQSRIEQLQAEGKQFGKQAVSLAEDTIRLQEEKVQQEVFFGLRTEVARIHELVEHAALAAALRPRVERLERGADALAESAREARRQADESTAAAKDLFQRMEGQAKRVEEASRASQVGMEERCAAVAAQCSSVMGHVTDAQTGLNELAATMRSLAKKEDIMELRQSLSIAAQEAKDREQAVLFGARCLSCNRVFDDVQQSAGVVDLPAEKQRAKLFAEVERALHSPKTEPMNPIKMLAVKVGRLGQVRCGTGLGATVEIRDAGNPACGVSDVQLLPVRGVSAFSGGGAISDHDPARTPMPLPVAPGSPAPLTTPGRRRRPGADGVAVTNDSQPPQSAGRSRSAPQGVTWAGRAVDGLIDFKHPLSQLVGRIP